MAEDVTSLEELTAPQASAAAAAPSIYDLVTDKSTTQALADTQRHKVAETEAFMSAEDRALAQDRTRAVNFLDREGIGPDDLQKWDVKAQRDRYRTDPIQEFGSLASVFAIAASAFTKAPMENALNGAAAAMNAARERNDKEYDRAYQVWKDNNELALKRHNVMHTQYVDALNLMTHDVTTGEAKLRQLAAKYGDQKIQTLLDHGYAPEVIEMIQSRAKAAEGLQRVLDNSQIHDFQWAAWKSWEKQNPNVPDAVKLGVMTAFLGADKFDQERTWTMQYFATHPFPQDGDQKKYFDDYATALRQHAQDKSSWRYTVGMGQHEQFETVKAGIRAEHPDWDDRKLTLATNTEIARSKKTLTPAQEDKARQQKDSRDMVINEISTAMKMIEEARKGGDSVIGATGFVGRAREFVTGEGSEHQRFRSLIDTIQTQVRPLLTGSFRSSLTKADQQKLDEIVPGIGFLKSEQQVYDTLEQLSQILKRGKIDVGGTRGALIRVETPAQVKELVKDGILQPGDEFELPDGRIGTVPDKM